MLKKAKLVGSGLCQGTNDYGHDKFLIYGLFSAPKTKVVLTLDKYGINPAHKAFEKI